MATEDKNEDRNARLKAFGLELSKRRKDAGYRYAKDFAPAIGISPQYLAQLENGSPSENQTARMPSAEILESVSDVLKWPKIEMLKMVGLVTDEELRESQVDDNEPPENFEDWPQELKEAMHYSQELSPEVQRHIYKLWREQARAHAEIEYERRRAQEHLDDLRKIKTD